jgi:hypothetical protein
MGRRVEDAGARVPKLEKRRFWVATPPGSATSLESQDA